MLYYIAYCLYIFFIVLQIDVLLYLLKNILPGAGWFKYFVDMLAAPALSPVQKLVKHSVLKCFRTADSTVLSGKFMLIYYGALRRQE